MLEDSAKNVIPVENGLLSGYKNKIRDFFKDNPMLLDLFNKVVSHLSDLQRFVKMANE